MGPLARGECRFRNTERRRGEGEKWEDRGRQRQLIMTMIPTTLTFSVASSVERGVVVSNELL